MRIKNIKIKNFHCYQDASFDFADKATILIGKNGSGKTSLIKSLKNALSVFFSNNSSWGYPTIVGSVNDLGVANLDPREIWHDREMKPAEYVDICMTAEMEDKNNGNPENTLSWSFYKQSTARAKLQATYYKEAYINFRQNYRDGDAWPLFAYYSDSYPHVDVKLGDSIKRMIDNDEKLYRSWGYYHWDYDTSCALIWQKRYMRIYNLYYKRLQSMIRDSDLRGKDMEQCQKDVSKYAEELNFVLYHLRLFTSNTGDNLSDISNDLQIRDIIVDGIDNPYLVVYFENGTRRRWDELPAGYARLYNIVFDIAYRSYILNGSAHKPQGVILIDELDLHLHPSMEQDVLQRLTSTFEGIQFIVSTHSPLVISNTSLGDAGKTILLQHEGDTYDNTTIADQYGMGYDIVLSAVMQTEPRNAKLRQLMDKYRRLMRRNKEQTAEDTLEAIRNMVTNERFEQIKRELAEE